MSKYVWLEVKDYVANLPTVSKVCFYLKMLVFVKQQFGCGVYVGKFRFNFANPLTWLLVFLIYIVCVLCSLWDIIVTPFKEVKKIFSDGVRVELDRNYKSTLK